MKPPTPLSLHVKEAITPEERLIAYQLRYRVFVDELRYEIPNARPEQGLTQPSDAHARIFVGFDGDTPAGTVTLNALKDGPVDHAVMRNYAVEPFLRHVSAAAIGIVHKALVVEQHRDDRLFHDMITGMIRTAFPAGMQFCFLESSPYLVRFHERMGFRRYAPAFTYPDSGMVSLPMCLVTTDLEYLRKVGSWLHPVLAERFEQNPEAGALFEQLSVAERPDPEAGVADGASGAGDPAGIDVRSVALFADMDLDDVASLLIHCQRVRVPRHATLGSQDGTDDDMFLLLSGCLEVTRMKDGRPVPVATLGPGSLTGEMSQLTGRPRSATMTMLTEGKVVRIPKAAVERLAGERPSAAALLYRNVARILADRVRVTTYWLTASPPL
jgi:hypothetical protein